MKIGSMYAQKRNRFIVLFHEFHADISYTDVDTTHVISKYYLANERFIPSHDVYLLPAAVTCTYGFNRNTRPSF